MHTEFNLPVKLTPEQEAERLREKYPVCAESADFIRSLFGQDAVVTAMNENGNEGKRNSYQADSEFSVVLDGEAFLRLGRLEREYNDGIAKHKEVGHGKRK